MREIKNKSDIKVIIDLFYSRVLQDELLGPIFSSKIPKHVWPSHLEKMYSFWNTVLFGASDYRGNPFSHHAKLPINEEHFSKWTSLLKSSVKSEFQGEKAEEMLLRAEKMSMMFQSKLEYIRSNPQSRSIM